MARYGGEEFAQHIQKELRALDLPNEHSASGYVTLSNGVASLIPSKEAAPLELVRLADAELYRVRASVRDRVVIFQG